MHIERVDPEDLTGRAVRGWYDVRRAARAADDPHPPPMSWQEHVGSLRYGWDGDRPEHWVAVDPDRGVVAGYQLELPRWDNRHLAEAEVVVHPARRRAGLGRALLAHLVARARAAGRRTLVGQVRTGSPGAGFAAAAGARVVLTDVRRVLDVTALAPAALTARRAEAEAASAAYRLLRWAGPTPAEHLAGVTALLTAMNDAPVGELDWEPEVWSAERIRAYEAAAAGRGDRPYTVVARHQPTGELAALTAVYVRGGHPQWSGQGDTVVLAAHRGHRLGLRVKLAMLPWLVAAEPAVRQLVTWNAASNRHMIAVNEALGYRVLDSWQDWQLDLTPPQVPVPAARPA
ncbi:MAG: GNAT family N-acetyltransferase [Actinomycetota bacterium]